MALVSIGDEGPGDLWPLCWPSRCGNKAPAQAAKHWTGATLGELYSPDDAFDEAHKETNVAKAMIGDA